jgi:hypothetical protein
MAHPSDINKVFHSITEPHLKFPVTVTILKNLKRATYSSKLDMHFGLAFECYTHFTSPIRRYPDLIVHRLLNAIEDRKPARISEAEMHELAMHCSGREQNAEEAENRDRGDQDGRVLPRPTQGRRRRSPTTPASRGSTRAASLVELVESLQRGMVPFETLKDDYYMVNPSGTKAEGRRTGRVLRLGDAASVIIAQVDPRLRSIEFSIVDGGSTPSGTQASCGRKPQAFPRRQAGGNDPRPRVRPAAVVIGAAGGSAAEGAGHMKRGGLRTFLRWLRILVSLACCAAPCCWSTGTAPRPALRAFLETRRGACWCASSSGGERCRTPIRWSAWTRRRSGSASGWRKRWRRPGRRPASRCGTASRVSGMSWGRTSVR